MGYYCTPTTEIKNVSLVEMVSWAPPKNKKYKKKVTTVFPVADAKAR